jgi:hypothetical protein
VYTLGTSEVTIATCTPETTAPSIQTDARSIHSSLGSLLTTAGDDGCQDKQHNESREKTLRLVSTTQMYAFPTDPGQFLRWESVTETELLSPPWCLDGVSIMRQPTTTPANAPISRHFASYLQRCALQGGEKVSRNLISGIQAKKYIHLGQGCKLFRLVLKNYKPVGPRWLWDYDLQWGDLKQAKSESVQELSGRIAELEAKLRDCCGLQLPEIAHKLKLVTCVCRGPYHDLYTDVYDKMCVRQEPGWDLQTLDLETLMNRLTTLLRNSQYWGRGSLKAGAYPQGKTTPTQARRAQDDPTTTDDWRGQLNLQPTQARELIAAFRCFICRTDNHYVGSCSHAKKCGFTVSYCPDGDSRSDRRRAPAAHRADPTAKPQPPGKQPPKVATPPAPAQKGVAFKTDAPSIPSTKGSDLDNESDDGDFVGWHTTNEAAVSTVDSHRARQAKASQAHTNLEQRQAQARTARARPVHCSSASLTRRTTGLDSKPDSLAWTPTRLQRARSSKTSSSPLDSYICVDSGASRDLFPDRSYFTDYTDISDQGHYVVVADDSRIPILGIGTVCCNLSGHEVLLRIVYQPCTGTQCPSLLHSDPSTTRPWMLTNRRPPRLLAHISYLCPGHR